MKDAIVKLFKVKSLITIILSAVFAVLAVRRDITAEQYLTIYSTVIAFYFGTQFERRNSEAKDDEPQD